MNVARHAIIIGLPVLSVMGYFTVGNVQAAHLDHLT